MVLDQTYFYPTGGGQEYDTGEIGAARVVDVYKDELNVRLIHVVQGDVTLGAVNARIDYERRLRHMQHHTAQHLLTQCILGQTGYETVSANINGYSPSTLDIVALQIDTDDLAQAEKNANQIIYEDRVVKTYFVAPEQLDSIPLRRPPKVKENIRIVEIDAYDYSPCGGTHVDRTGSIGLVKVLKAERQNDKMRVYFIAGLQAMDVFRLMYDSINGLANQMSVAWQDIPDVVEKQAEQLGTLKKEMQTLRMESVRYEAGQLVRLAEESAGIKLVRAIFDHRPVIELRMLAEELKKITNLVSYLVSFDGQKISLIVTCGEASGKDARQLLYHRLSLFAGRGGGDARLAQGGGTATEEQFRHFIDQIDRD